MTNSFPMREVRILIIWRKRTAARKDVLYIILMSYLQLLRKINLIELKMVQRKIVIMGTRFGQVLAVILKQ